MEATREDASGQPLLVDGKTETAIDMEQPPLTPVPEDSVLGDRSGFTRKKLSLARNVSLKPIIVPQNPVVQTRGSHLFTPTQANSPLRQYSLGQQGLGSADLQHIYKSIISVRVFLPHLFKEDGEDNCSTCVKVEVSRLSTAEEITNSVAETQDVDKEQANEAFALWMISPLLELQLKPHHQPCELRKSWSSLLEKFAADATPQQLQTDEPLLMIKRRVQLSSERELQLCADTKILNLLYVDAKCNLFSDRYYMSSCSAAALAGIGFAIENSDTEATVDFIRKNLEGQLPDHLADCIRGSMLFGKSLSNGRELDTVLTTWRDNRDVDHDELKRMYLAKLHECCHQYGSAFFHGFIERPSISPLKNLKRFFQSVATGDADMPVTIGINRETITVIDSEKHETILKVPIMECVWKKVTWEGAASVEDIEKEVNEPSQPMLLLHFPEFFEIDKKMKGMKPRTNVLQIFGYQTILIHSMLDNMHVLLRKEAGSEPNSASSTSSSEGGKPVIRTPSLTKCDRMCLATFVNGECVKASGSMKKVVQKMQKAQAAH